jgi:hypothetical protein
MKHLYAHRKAFEGEAVICPVFNRKGTFWRRRVNEGVLVFGHSWRGFDRNVEVVTHETGVGMACASGFSLCAFTFNDLP